MSNFILWLQRAGRLGRFALVWIINKPVPALLLLPLRLAGRRYFLIRRSAASTSQKLAGNCWLNDTFLM